MADSIYHDESSFLNHSAWSPQELAYMKAVIEAAGPGKHISFIDPDDFKDALKTIDIDYDTEDYETFVKKLLLLPEKDLNILIEEIKKISGSKIPENIVELFEKDTQNGTTPYDNIEDYHAVYLINQLVDGTAINQISKNEFIATIPTDYEDSLKERVTQMLPERAFDEEMIDNVIKNSPFNDIQQAIAEGLHEGGHAFNFPSAFVPIALKASEIKDSVNSHYLGQLNGVIVLEAEVDADSIMAQRLTENGHSDQALFEKDLRALSILNELTFAHSTSALLKYDAPATSLHNEINDNMISIANNIEGISAYDMLFEEKRYELLKNEPETFFAKIYDFLEQKTSEILENPDYPDRQTNLARMQITTDYAHDFEAAYMRREMGQRDFPDYEPIRLLPENEFQEILLQTRKNDFIGAYEEICAQNAKNSFPLKLDNLVDGIPYESEKALIIDRTKRHDEKLTQIRDEAIAKYEADPSQENLINLVEAQYFITNETAKYMETHMSEYTDTTLGIECNPIATFVTEEQLHQYYEYIEQEMHLNETSFSSILDDTNLTQILEAPIQYIMEQIAEEKTSSSTNAYIKATTSDITEPVPEPTAQFNSTSGATVTEAAGIPPEEESPALARNQTTALSTMTG